MPKHSSLKRKPTNITLSGKTLTLLSAFAQFKKTMGEPEPSRAWMIERGAELFLESMEKKFPKFRPIRNDIQEQFSKIEEINRYSGKGGIVRSIVGVGKRKKF